MAATAYVRNLARFEATARERTTAYKELEDAHARTLERVRQVERDAAAAMAAVKELAKKLQDVEHNTSLRQHVTDMENRWVAFVWPGAIEIELRSINQLQTFMEYYYYHRVDRVPTHVSIRAVEEWEKLSQENRDAIAQRLTKAGPYWLKDVLADLRNCGNRQNHSAARSVDDVRAQLDGSDRLKFDDVIKHDKFIASLKTADRAAKAEQGDNSQLS